MLDKLSSTENLFFIVTYLSGMAMGIIVCMLIK